MTSAQPPLPPRPDLKPKIIICAAGLAAVIGMVAWMVPYVSGHVLVGVVASGSIAAIALIYAGWEAWQVSIKTVVEEKLRSTVSQMKASWDDAPLSVILFDPHATDV